MWHLLALVSLQNHKSLTLHLNCFFLKIDQVKTNFVYVSRDMLMITYVNKGEIVQVSFYSRLSNTCTEPSIHISEGHIAKSNCNRLMSIFEIERLISCYNQINRNRIRRKGASDFSLLLLIATFEVEVIEMYVLNALYKRVLSHIHASVSYPWFW